MATPKQIVEKYHDIITEEVNVKKVSLLDDQNKVTVQYVPLGSKLGASFGKDTGRIIAAAKQGNGELVDGKLKVTDAGDEWLLTDDQYEIRYSGFDGDNQIVEDATMVELDLTLTPKLINEGIAREFSRFLNQMRKDADYQVNDRVSCGFVTDSDAFSGIIATHEIYLKTEALLLDVQRKKIEGDIEAEFEYEGDKITFSLQRKA